MKKYINTLFDNNHYIKTSILLLFSGCCFIGAYVIGITDNLPGILLLFLSSGFMILALTYIWKNPMYFFNMAAICFAIICILWLSVQAFAIIASPAIQQTYDGIIEAIMFLSIFFLLIPAVLIGIAGGIYNAIKANHHFQH